MQRSFLSGSIITDRRKPIRSLTDQNLRNRILSAYYYFADEEAAAANTWYTPALAMSMDNVVLGNEMRLQFQPLILSLPTHISQCFYEMAGPEKENSLKALNGLLSDAFENFKPAVVIGFKPGFWGGQKPVTMRMNLPLVEGIGRVLD